MTLRVSIAIAALIALAHSAPAQEVSGRLDLEAIAPLPHVPLVTVRVTFVKDDVACPEDFGLMRISAAGWRHYRPALPWRSRIWGAITTPPDDETQLFRLAAQGCRFDIAIRQQIRREDGAWASLLVPRRVRPSVPEEERRELRRQIMERLKERPITSPYERPGPLKEAWEALGSIGSLGGSGVFSSGALFDDPPATCLEALGDYLIEQQDVAFLFAIGLPGDLNRFTIERTDIDEAHSRLHLVRGDCRFELTIGKSIRRDGEWRAVPVAPFVKANEPGPEFGIRK
jgi:hypothetical protein